MQQFN